MEKLMNPKAAENVFSNSKIAHGFLKNGGAKYISAASREAVNPDHVFYVSKGITMGMPHNYGENKPTDKGVQMMESANKELMEGQLISSAEMHEVNAEVALRIVEKAEKQTANNNTNSNMAGMMVRNSGITY